MQGPDAQEFLSVLENISIVMNFLSKVFVFPQPHNPKPQTPDPEAHVHAQAQLNPES